MQSISNWKLEMLGFEVVGKIGVHSKNFLGARREPTTNSTHLRRPVLELNPSLPLCRRLIKPRPHWQEVTAFNTTLSLLPSSAVVRLAHNV